MKNKFESRRQTYEMKSNKQMIKGNTFQSAACERQNKNTLSPDFGPSKTINTEQPSILNDSLSPKLNNDPYIYDRLSVP